MIHTKKVLLSGLDKEIQNTLNTNEPDDVKAKLYANTLRKYITIMDTPRTNTKPVDDDVESDVLESAPSQHRYKAKRLLRTIKESPEASWSPRGEFIYRQRLVPNSNIIDLINDLLRNSTTAAPPTGWEEFSEFLKNENIAKELIVNKQRWKYMYKTVKDTSFVETPRPSKRKRKANKKFADLEWEEY